MSAALVRKAMVILESDGKEIERETVEIPSTTKHPELALDEEIQDAISSWILSPGDVIRILAEQ